MHTIIVDLDAARNPALLLAYGGAPAGGDDVHRTIASWRGWRREARPVDHPDLGRVSRYRAPLYPSTLLGMDLNAVTVRWTLEAHAARLRCLVGHDEAVRALATSPKLLPRFLTPTERQPMEHQLQAIHALHRMKFRALLADDMGLGKTATALWSVYVAGATRLLVVCPVAVKRNWMREIHATLGTHWSVALIDGSKPRRAQQFADLAHAHTKEPSPLACIINYDLLIALPAQQAAYLEDFSRSAFLICDESHALKSRRAKRTVFVRDRLHSQHRLLLTGTPIRNTAEDLYSQLEILRPGTWTSATDFTNRHLVTRLVQFGSRTQQVVSGTKNVELLNEVLSTMQVRRKKEQVLNLPPKIRTYPELDLDAATGKVYRAMKDFAVLKLSELDDGLNVFDPRAQSGVEAAMRCEQIAQGFLGGIPEQIMQQLSGTALKYAESIPGRPQELIFPHAPKIAWLLETIDDIRTQGGKPVVFSRFNAPMQWLAAYLAKQDIRVSRLHGALSSAQKEEQIQTFQQGYTEVFICQIQMAEGFNLVQSQDVIFFGRDWSPAVNSQAEDRCHRIGQKGTVNIQIPIVLKTVEWPIHKRLEAKHADAESALTMTIRELKESL